MTNDTDPTAGVWIVGSFDWNFIVDSVYATELEALRVINGRGYGEVHFVPFGADIQDASLRVKATDA